MTPDDSCACSDTELDLDLRWWDAANYLTVGQIYLGDNALLREPLTAAHIKPRLLGHWGTSPALSAIYVALNRLGRRAGLFPAACRGRGVRSPGPAHRLEPQNHVGGLLVVQ